MAKSDADIAAIRRRWAPYNAELKWASIPRERRERVVGEIEETDRELGNVQPQLASDLALAADVLDSDDAAPLLELLEQAQADIHQLLDRLTEKQ